MTFIHPTIAWITLGLLTVPLIVHLLTRRRYREEPWAAMSFLVAAQRRSRRRMRLEQWLLLALRTLVVAALGFAIARPALTRSAFARAVGESRFDRLLIIDDTLSMQALRPDGATAFDDAQMLATRLIESFSRSDAVAVITLSSPPRALVEQPTVDHALVNRVIHQLPCSHKPADLAAAMRLGREVLAAGDAAPECKAVYCLTDLARSTWQRESPSASRTVDPANANARSSDADAVTAVLSTLGSAEHRYVLNTGAARRPNLAVTGISLANSWVTPAIPVMVAVEVRSFDGPVPPDASVELRIDGGVAERKSLDSKPDVATHRLQFQVRFTEPGTHALTARLKFPGDVLPADDQRSLAVEVSRDVPVLIVSGTESPAADSHAFNPPAIDDEAFYFALALTPLESGVDPADQSRLFAPRLIPPSALDDAILEDHRAVVLLDLPTLSPANWTRLARFVRGGGGLMIGLGDNADLAHYAEMIGPDAADPTMRGLLPVRPLDTVLPDANRRPARLRIHDWTHPIVSDLAGHVGGGLLVTPVHGYVKLDTAGRADITAGRPDATGGRGSRRADSLGGRADSLRGRGSRRAGPEETSPTQSADELASAVRPIIEFDTGDVALAEHHAFRGRVLLWTSSMRMDWSTLPAQPDFVPLILNMTAHLAAPDPSARNLRAGDVLSESLALADSQRGPLVRRPDSSEDSVSITNVVDPLHGGTRIAAHYNRTDVPGVYVFDAAMRPRHFAVTTDPNESDLAPMGEIELRQRLAAPFTYVESPDDLLSHPTDAPQEELAGSMIGALFVLVLAETCIAAWFGRRR